MLGGRVALLPESAACLEQEVLGVLDRHEVVQKVVPVVLVGPIPAQPEAKHAQGPEGVVRCWGLAA